MGITDIYPPEPASKNMPEWYKSLESYYSGKKIPDGNGRTTATIKKCMPVFDAISAGYIIKTPVDVYVSQKPATYLDKHHFEKTGEEIELPEEKIKEMDLPPTIPHYEWVNFGILEFHPIEQAPNYPNKKGRQESFPKWINPWAISTPPGYSTMFFQPWHRESVFTIMPGIVDTDVYSAAVNFPFILNSDSWEGLIPAGTPIAQVVPFKREEWKMEFGTNKDLVEQTKITTRLRTKFFDSYKTQYRQSKEYR